MENKKCTNHTKDLTGMTFGSWTVLGFDLEGTRKHRNNAYWFSKCTCGTERSVRGTALKQGKSLSCGHSDNYRNIGKRFGKLTILDTIYKTINGTKREYYKCHCDCGREKDIRCDGINSGSVVSCGECSKNTFKLSDDKTYYIAKCPSGGEFYFDIDDYELVSSSTWTINSDGYVVANTNIGYLYLHRIIMNASENEDVDHIEGNKNDNRKKYLRTCSRANNTRNKNILPRNTEIGINGVSFSKTKNKWISTLTYDYEKVYCEEFTNLEDDIHGRTKAEQQYFGEYAYTSRQNAVNKNN